jgi:Tol biopolymer transport system component
MIYIRPVHMGNYLLLSLGCSVVLLIGCNSGEDSWRHYAGGGVFPTDSPDLWGDTNSVVYASPESGHGDIYLCDASLHKTRQLTNDSSFESSPCFLGSAERILFVREKDGRRHVRMLDTDSSSDTAVTSGNVIDDIKQVSTDGLRLLITRSKVRSGQGRLVSDYLLIRSPETGWGQPLLVGSVASMSAAGRLIAYESPTRSPEVWLWNTETNERTRLCDGMLAGLSPSGAFVLLRGPETEGPDMQLKLLETGSLKTTDLLAGHSAIFAPDESGVVLLEGYAKQLTYVDLHGQVLRRLALPRGVVTQPRLATGVNKCVFSVFPSHGAAVNHYAFDIASREIAPLVCGN